MRKSAWRLDLKFPGYRVSDVATPLERFERAQAVVIASADEMHLVQPAIRRSLSVELGVERLAAKLCPVSLSDGSVAILALADHVGSDQADELARRICARGLRLATPQRYILAAPLLLSIARHQWAEDTVASGPNVAGSGSALAGAFQDMVEWGVRHGASDLHFNVQLDQPDSEVRFTLQGRYVAPERFRRIPTATLNEMLAVAWMDIRGGNGAVFDPTTEQQGALIRQVDGRSILLRWASMAAERGPSVCLRLLDRTRAGETGSLECLGYLPHQASMIGRCMLSEGGAVVFAGTVGSGKSTTLASQIAMLPPERKVMTLEDPVEYLIPGAVQNTVSRDPSKDRHDGFSAKLRALKRSAMTDVLLGEVRDRETGEAFMDLASSGVNVYTTTHAPSALLVAERLASSVVGVSRDFLATPGILKLVVYQALMPCLCPHCSLDPIQAAELGLFDNPLADQVMKSLDRVLDGRPDTLRFRNPHGCPSCAIAGHQILDGYAGRTVVAECFEPHAHPGYLASMKRADSGAYCSLDTHAGMRLTQADEVHSSLACAAYKVVMGQLDPFDAERRFQVFQRLCAGKVPAAFGGC
ncbi:MAG: GspE/PulE family protein [Pusillimonas sp.]